MPYVYYFNANRTYNKTKTAQLRAASRTNKNATTIKKLLGKYKNTKFPKTVVSEMETEWISPILMIM